MSNDRLQHFCATFNGGLGCRFAYLNCARLCAIIFFIFFLTVFCARSQELVFKRADFNERLPSNESYHVFQDGQGYLWVATEMGLCRWNGRQMLVYDGSKGLPERAIYTVKENRGRIWMVSSRNRIFTLAGGRISEHPISRAYVKMMDPAEEFTYRLDFGTEMVFNTKWASYIADTVSGTFRKVPVERNRSIVPVIGNRPVVMNSRMASPTSNIDFRFDGNGNIPKNTSVPFRGGWTYRYMDCVASGRSFFSYNEQLLEILPDRSVRRVTMPANISYLYADRQGDLWVGLYKRGVRYYPKGDTSAGIAGLDGLSVASVFQDREGNIWCATLERGVFMCRQKELLDWGGQLGGTSEQMLLRPVANGILVAGGHEVHGVDWKGNLVNGNEIFRLLPGSLRTEEGLKLLGSSLLLDIKALGSDSILGIGYSNIYVMEAGRMLTIPIDRPGRCILPLGAGRAIYGSNDGLYNVELSTGKQFRMVGTNCRVTALARMPAGGILVGTKGDGAFYLRNGKLLRYEIPADIIYDIAIDSSGTIWFATSRGLVRSNPNGQTLVFDVQNGLPSNSVLKVAASGTNIFFATSLGVAMFPVKKEFRNLMAMPLRLSAVTAGGEKTVVHSGSVLPYHQSSLRFSFELLSFANSASILRYRFSTDTAYRYSSGGEVVAANQEPGDYRLTVEGVNSDGMASRPMVFSYSIATPFWRELWFVLACVIILGVAVFAIATYFLKRSIRKNDERERIDRLIAESKLEAIQAQMNPHFVFNCINSIQNYIIKRDVETACEYLSQFSRLIRAVLNHSNEQTIALAQELELLELYISLERQRFDRGFAYELTVAGGVDIDHYRIPAMLIQPFVENAIWHGLMPLEDRVAKLEVSIAREGHHLRIQVRDNGIGRTRAAQYGRHGAGKRFGVKLNQQRIGNLNQIYKGQNFRIEIIDEHDGHVPSGTTVLIHIPLIYG